MSSTAPNRYCAASFDFATVSSCDQLVFGPTQARVQAEDVLASFLFVNDLRHVFFILSSLFHLTS